MAKGKDIADLPLINSRQAAIFFFWSARKFKRKFDEVLHEEIATSTTRNVVRYLLTDVLRYAYPDASDATIHLLAVEVAYREAASRKKTGESRQLSKERGKEK